MSDPPTLATQVGQNDLILRNIIFHCDDVMLRTCLLVNSQWNWTAHVVIQMKMKVIQCIVPFLFERCKLIHKTAISRKRVTCRAVKQTFSEFVAGKVKGPRSFMKNLLHLIRGSAMRPYCVIILEGIENRMLMDDRNSWTRVKVLNSLRPNLPHDCALIGIDAHYGIIGESSETALTNSKDPMTLSYYVNGILGISGLVFPKYDGVKITTFAPNEEDREIEPDVRALIHLSSDFGYGHNNCLSSPQAHSIYNHYRGRLALAGAQIDSPAELAWRANDDGNYYFINGPPPYNDEEDPELMPTLAIQFSGPNCRAASLKIPQKYSRCDPIFRRNATELLIEELKLIKYKLREFRSKLTFPCDSSDEVETIGFLFFNINCYRDYRSRTGRFNSGIELFFKIFPKTLISGVLCHVNYQHNFIPGLSVQMDAPGTQNELFSDRCIASFILVCMKKSNFRR